MGITICSCSYKAITGLLEGIQLECTVKGDDFFFILHNRSALPPSKALCDSPFYSVIHTAITAF